MNGNQARYQNIKNQESIAGIKINIFDAVNGSKLNIPQLQKEGKIKSPWDTYRYNNEHDTNKKQKILNGEVGCFLSHQQLLQKISNQSFDGWTVIFEDNLLLTPHFTDDLNKILPELPHDIDIVYLGNTHQHDCKKGVYKNNLCYPDTPYGTQSYMVNKKSAKKILDLIPIVDDPIDVKYDILMKNNQMKGLVVIPTLVKQNDDIPSVIQPNSS